MANTAANADGLYLGARVSYSLSFDNHDVFDPRRIRCLGLGLKVADVKSTFLPPPPSFYFMRSCMGIYFYRRLVRWVSTFCQPPPVSPSPSLPQSPSQSPRPVPTHVQIRGPHGPGGCPPWQLHTPTPHSATERGRATAKTVNRMGKSAPRPLACQVSLRQVRCLASLQIKCDKRFLDICDLCDAGMDVKATIAIGRNVRALVCENGASLQPPGASILTFPITDGTRISVLIGDFVDVYSTSSALFFQFWAP